MYQAQLDQLTQQTFNMEQTAMVTENLKNTVSSFSMSSDCRRDMLTGHATDGDRGCNENGE
jgi:charged multivesicular body protein 5